MNQEPIFTGFDRKIRLKPKCPKCNSVQLWAKHLNLCAKCDEEKILKEGLL